MQALFSQISQQVSALTAIEFIAVVAAIAYLLLAIRQSIWCWLFAAVSTAIYVYLFIEAKLYMESFLNGFYFLMAAYGWHVWRTGGDSSAELPVSVWPFRIHSLAIVSIALLGLLTGYLLQRFTDAALPYIDSLTTLGAIWATFLVARKVLENWWYWLAIDVASVAVYWSRDLQLTALLFMVYVVLIPFGLVSWRRSLARQRSLAMTA